MKKETYDKIYGRVLEAMKKDYIEDEKYGYKEGMLILTKLAKEWKSYKNCPEKLSDDEYVQKFAWYVF